MARKNDRFTILLCGNKELTGEVRKLMPTERDVHLQFASAPGFLVGRALFNVPRLVLIDVTKDTLPLRASLKEFRSQIADVPIIALARQASHRLAVDLVKLGVTEYYVYPQDQRKIREQIALLYKEWTSHKDAAQLVELQSEVSGFKAIIGDSPLIQIVVERARKLIKNSAMTVLITGETGTGKEMFAHAIHYNSPLRHHPFIDIACSALPESLLESELFGYERGAFTDAKERKLGLFELAGEGSIFLDEIGDISMAMQSKLLKVIEQRTMRRLGGVRDVPVRARVIAATSVDLEAKMRSGEFRRDLYHRLKILPLEIPSLSERLEDIPLLTEAFVKHYNRTYKKHIKGVTPHALQLLMDHPWEGNVRELKHSIERAVLLEEGDWLTEQDFDLPSHPETPRRKRIMAAGSDRKQAGNEGATLMLMVPLAEASTREVEHLLIAKVMESVGGNKLKASRILKISRPKLDRILRGSGLLD